MPFNLDIKLFIFFIFISKYKIYINKYKIKQVIPNYGFNENKTYKTWTNLKIGFFLNKLKIPGLLFWSKYIIYPYHDLELHYVFGKSIQFPTIENPTKEDVNKYH